MLASPSGRGVPPKGGEQFGEAGHRLRPAAAVQQQEGAALAPVVDGECERPGAGQGNGERAGGHGSS